MGPREWLMLLLCCPLGRNIKPLSNGEYRSFAQRFSQADPRFREQPITDTLLVDLGCNAEEAQRIVTLLKGEVAALAYLRARPEVQPICRLNPAYPPGLRKLPEPPAALFCLGDLSLLHKPMVSLVGNRLLSEEAGLFAARLGRCAAKAGRVLVSGDAQGADRTAQEACLEAGGQVLSLLPGALPRKAQPNMLFCSLNGYAHSFSAKRALERNYCIHALGQPSFVAQCRDMRGGTWDGSTYNLRHGLSPLWVLPNQEVGTAALLDRGAKALSQSPEEEELLCLLTEINDP